MFNPMKSKRILTNVVVCLTVMIFHGCTTFRAPELRDGETATQCLANISEKNDLLVSCKGIAKVSTHGFGFTLNERIAFISQKTHQLRAEMLSPFGAIGSPFQLICTPKKLFLKSHFLKKPFYTRPDSYFLKKALPIKIQTQELILFLHGQLPILPGMHAKFDRLSKNKTLLLTKGLFKKTRQRIIFDGSEKHVRSFEKYNHFNELLYRLTFDRYQNYNIFSVPSKMTISNDANQCVTFDIQSYYPNCAIKKNPFLITIPEHTEKGEVSCVTSWIFKPIQALLNIF